jgi:hypothetical protein
MQAPHCSQCGTGGTTDIHTVGTTTRPPQFEQDPMVRFMAVLSPKVWHRTECPERSKEREQQADEHDAVNDVA